jgi:hypothetical protein
MVTLMLDKCVVVESIGGGGYTLTNLHLVLLAGCGLDTSHRLRYG